MRKEKDVTGIMEPRGTEAEMRQLFDEIEFLIHPDFTMTDDEVDELRGKIKRLKKYHKFN